MVSKKLKHITSLLKCFSVFVVSFCLLMLAFFAAKDYVAGYIGIGKVELYLAEFQPPVILDNTDTLSGIDSNNNGIRDDVAQYIDAIHPSIEQRYWLERYAFSLNSMVSNTSKDAAVINPVINDFLEADTCVEYMSMPAKATNTDVRKLMKMMHTNTFSRLRNFKRNASETSSINAPEKMDCGVRPNESYLHDKERMHHATFNTLMLDGVKLTKDHSDLLPGADANHNNIRDDIEDFIRSSHYTPLQKRAMAKLASALSDFMAVDNQDILLINEIKAAYDFQKTYLDGLDAPAYSQKMESRKMPASQIILGLHQNNRNRITKLYQVSMKFI